MQDGKALQAGTSHDLGQHFSKSFGTKYLGTDGQLHHAWTTSWGTSTRMMGGLFMTHSDDDGLVLPPAVAPYRAVIIPIARDGNEDTLNTYANKIAEQLCAAGIRVLADTSDMRGADKMWKWIKRGVPLRVEIGGREMEDGTVTITRRDLGKSSKQTLAVADFVAGAQGMLKQMHDDMYAAAAARNAKMIKNVDSLDALSAALSNGEIGFFRLKYDLTLAPEFDAIMEQHKVSRRCLDDTDPTYVFVAKSY